VPPFAPDWGILARPGVKLPLMPLLFLLLRECAKPAQGAGDVAGSWRRAPRLCFLDPSQFEIEPGRETLLSAGISCIPTQVRFLSRSAGILGLRESNVTIIKRNRGLWSPKMKLSVQIMFTCTVTLLAGTALNNPSQAAEYLYHPHSPLGLGVGFDPIAVADTKSDCLDDDGTSNSQTTGATSTTFDVSIVKTHQELIEKTQRDTSISASYTFFSAGYSQSEFNQYSFSKNSLTWVLRGFSTYGTVSLVNPRLKQIYSSLHDDVLIRRCGSEVITKETKGAQVALIYHLEDLSESTVSRLERSFEAGVSYGALSANFKDKYQQFLAKAASVSKVGLNIDVIGGPGIAALSDLVTKADDVAHVETVISAYLSQIRPDNAAGMKFYSASTLVALAGRADSTSDAYKRQAIITLYDWK
jgi:hypothetical protein